MRALIAVCAFLMILYASPASSDVYRYVDENGTLCYTDAPMGKQAEKVLAEKRTSGKKTKVVDYTPPAAAVKRDYSGYVQQAAAKYEIEPELIHAVIKTESNGNELAVSRKGAMGLMQLMPSTANDLNVLNPFDPAENIDGGTKYLKQLLDKFNGDLTLALAAYNAGPKTVEKYRDVPPISETRQYVKKIIALFKGKGYDYASDSSRPASPAPEPVRIYKVVLDDGTILFTNSSFTKTGRARF